MPFLPLCECLKKAVFRGICIQKAEVSHEEHGKPAAIGGPGSLKESVFAADVLLYSYFHICFISNIRYTDTVSRAFRPVFTCQPTLFQTEGKTGRCPDSVPAVCRSYFRNVSRSFLGRYVIPRPILKDREFTSALLTDIRVSRSAARDLFSSAYFSILPSKSCFRSVFMISRILS